MGNKPEYILDIEKTEGILSVVEFSHFDETKYEQTLKKMPIVYGNSIYDVNTKKLMWDEKIFKLCCLNKRFKNEPSNPSTPAPLTTEKGLHYLYCVQYY